MLAMLPVFARMDDPIRRETRPNLVRRYRIVVDQEGGDHYAYRFEAKVVVPTAKKEVKAEVHLQFKLTDYHATMSGQSVSSRLIGGGEVPFDPWGLPSGLSIAGAQGPVWLPLLCLYLPVDDQASFEISGVAIGPGLLMAGKGTIASPRGGREVDWTATISRKERKIGTLTIATALDREGWPARSNGTLVSEDGTYRFTLR